MDQPPLITSAPATPGPRRGLRVTTLMAVVLVVGGLLGLSARALWQAREAARDAGCGWNLKQIGIALQNYHEVNGCFPPAYLADSTGKPMHSWRILILPYLESSSTYGAYNFAEPWDGPRNRRFLDRRPSSYRCPSQGARPLLTSYVMIVGPGTISPGASSRSLGDVRDGAGRTILVAEVANLDIPWTEPRDLDARAMSWAIDDPSRPSLSSPHGTGPGAVFADGTFRRLGGIRLWPDRLRALTTIAGGEPDPPR
jgi:hypothetical protein